MSGRKPTERTQREESTDPDTACDQGLMSPQSNWSFQDVYGGFLAFHDPCKVCFPDLAEQEPTVEDVLEEIDGDQVVRSSGSSKGKFHRPRHGDQERDRRGDERLRADGGLGPDPRRPEPVSGDVPLDATEYGDPAEVVTPDVDPVAAREGHFRDRVLDPDDPLDVDGPTPIDSTAERLSVRLGDDHARDLDAVLEDVDGIENRSQALRLGISLLADVLDGETDLVDPFGPLLEADHHLRQALDRDTPAEIRYHVREASQLLDAVGRVDP